MRLYIVRHADPDYVNDSITEKGHREAKALAKKFSKQGLDKIYCSPKGRAIATMNYTRELLKLEGEIEEWTQEVWPQLYSQNEEGRYKALFQYPGETFRSAYPLPAHDSWEKAEIFRMNPDAREAIHELRADSDQFLKRLGYERSGGLYRCIKPNQEQIAIFCHAGFALTWLSILLEIPVTLMWSGFFLPPSSVTTILFEERSGEWAVPRCIGLGDVSHVYEAGMNMSTIGLEGNLV